MRDTLRIPVNAISNVLGMGVAVNVSTSTVALISLMRSLAETPNRCSSSTTNKPRSWKSMSSDKSRCVPMTTSTDPSAIPATTAFCCFAVRNRLKTSHAEWIGGKAVGEHLVMLLGEQRRRDEHCGLAAVLDGFEYGTDCDLSLAEADVAENEPVHRLGGLHSGPDVGNGGQLIWRFLECEGRLHLALPWGVGRIGVAGNREPLAVQRHHLLGHGRYRLTHFSPGCAPSRHLPSETVAETRQPVYRRTAANWSVGTYRRSWPA